MAFNCVWSDMRKRPSPCATGNSIGSEKVMNGDRPGLGNNPTQRLLYRPDSLAASVVGPDDPPGRSPPAHQNLKPIADAQQQAAPVVKPPESFAQRGGHPGRQDAAGPEVVAVGETPGNRQDLEAIQLRRPRDDLVDVPGFGVRPARPSACAVSSSQLVPGARKTNPREVEPWLSITTQNVAGSDEKLHHLVQIRIHAHRVESSEPL